MKKIFALISILIVAIAIYAVPAYRRPLQVTQADGSTITINNNGDEHFHYITDNNGRWLKWDKGVLVETEALTEQQIIERRESSPMRKAQMRRVAQAEVNLAPRGLVILVNFSDLSFKAKNTRDEFDNMMNQPDYTYQRAKGSVKDYFRSQSFGMYDPIFDVVGPVTLENPYKYYGENTGSYDQDAHPDEMIIEACKKADTEWNVDFSQYDNDNDGIVDFVFVFYAGYGEADYGYYYDKNVVWPHMSYVYNYGYGQTCRIDGKLIDQYACSNELPYTSTGSRTYHVGINTCCHEFSHVMGLPDMYNTQNSEDFTMGNWDIMDAGPYNNSGRTPPAYSGYERFFCGFVKPVVLNSPCDVSLTEIQRSGQVLLITSTGEHNLAGNTPNPTIFYVLENRQKAYWDKYLPGHGLLVTKIQYNRNAWYNNTVNINTSNHRIAIQPADGSITQNQTTGVIGDGGDTYPGTSKVTSYTPISTYPITNITETDSIIHFQFMGGGQEISLGTSDIEQNELNIFATTSGIQIDGLTNNQQIQIYNLIGQLMHSEFATQNSITIPLEKGIYIIKTDKIIKKIIVH